jgi:hypothetical protein
LRTGNSIASWRAIEAVPTGETINAVSTRRTLSTRRTVNAVATMAAINTVLDRQKAICDLLLEFCKMAKQLIDHLHALHDRRQILKATSQSLSGDPLQPNINLKRYLILKGCASRVNPLPRLRFSDLRLRQNLTEQGFQLINGETQAFLRLPTVLDRAIDRFR